MEKGDELPPTVLISRELIAWTSCKHLIFRVAPNGNKLCV